MHDEIVIYKVLERVEELIKEIKYGKIVIELQENSDKIDIVSEVRERFTKNKKPH
ncbi:MAG: hypothetical protein PVI88_00150 [Nitrosopumilaceae archaeon]|jgi:hypothetical protein